MNREILFLLLLIIVITPVSIIDIRKKIIPDVITYPAILLVAGLLVFVYRESLMAVVSIMLVGFVPFYLIRYFTGGKMGLGDAKLSLLLALLLGIEGWLLMVFLSSVAALLFAVTALKAGKLERDSRIPYGPFLGLGALISHLILM